MSIHLIWILDVNLKKMTRPQNTQSITKNIEDFNSQKLSLNTIAHDVAIA